MDSGQTGGLLQWHRAGHTGQGTKVGIIGLFDTTALNGQVSAGEVPAVPTTARRCIAGGASCAFGTPGQTWGNSLAEIVADGAPDAALYLAELGGRTDYYPIIDWLAANGVTIVVNPLVWTYDGPGNGTGPSAAIVDYAVSKGIAWFNTAGEMGTTDDATSFNGAYWRGQWSDPDGDRWLNFRGSDEALAVYCGYLLGLRWSDWGATRTDYDLWVADYRTSTNSYGTLKVLSNAVQGAPLEGTAGADLCNTNAAAGPVYDTNKDGFVSLWVQRKSTSPSSGAAGDIIEIGLGGGFLEYANDAAGIALAFADSANPGMATVGGNWDFHLYKTSSSGPTNDNRIKPTFVAPMCIATSQDGPYDNDCNTGYFGTDGSAAWAASYAAMAHSAFNFPNPKAMVLWVRDQAIDQWYNRNKYGLGSLGSLSEPPPTGFHPGRFVPNDVPERIVDTRSGLGTGVVGPLPPDGTLKTSVPISLSHVQTAVVLNIAVVNGTGNGWLSAYPHGWSYPGATSILNYDAGQNRANMVVLPIGGTRTIDIYSSAGGHLIVDFVGEIRRDAEDGQEYPEAGNGRLRALTPFRTHDSRDCASPPCAPYAAGSYVDIPLAGIADPADASNFIPSNATAVALSVTVDSPSAKGYASVLPGGQSAILTSNLNFDAAKSATTMVFAPLNATGLARVFLSVPAHLQVDVLGWFTPTTGFGDPLGMFVPMTPIRAIDTRFAPHTKPAAGANVAVDVGAVGVPDGAMAALVNNVSTQGAGNGEVQVGAEVPTPPHEVRSLSFWAGGRSVAGATLTQLNEGEMVMTPSASTHLISDVSGYWRGPEVPPPAGSVVKVTQTFDGSPLNNHGSQVIGVSDDGGTVLFGSYATNLTSTPNASGIYVWKRSTNTVTAFPYTAPASRLQLSGDGNSVVFISDAVLLPADLDGTRPSVYVATLEPATLRVISDLRPPQPAGGGFNVEQVQISDDGSRVAWVNMSASIKTLHWYDLTTSTDHVLTQLETEQIILHGSGTALATLVRDFSAQSSVVKIYDLGTGTTKTITVPVSRFERFTGWTADKSTIALYNSNFVTQYFVLINAPAGTATFLQPPTLTPYMTANSGAIDGDADEMLLWTTAKLNVCNLAGSDCQKVTGTWNADPPNSGLSSAPAMSSDGRFVVYATYATNVLDESPGQGNIYIVDRSLLP